MENITVTDEEIMDYWVNEGYDPVYHELIHDSLGSIVGYITRSEHVEQPRTLSRFAMLSRFTYDEQIAIYSSQDVGVKVFLKNLDLSSEVDLDLPQVQAAIQHFVNLGLIEAFRVEALLSDPIETEAT